MLFVVFGDPEGLQGLFQQKYGIEVHACLQKHGYEKHNQIAYESKGRWGRDTLASLDSKSLNNLTRDRLLDQQGMYW